MPVCKSEAMKKRDLILSQIDYTKAKRRIENEDLIKKYRYSRAKFYNMLKHPEEFTIQDLWDMGIIFEPDVLFSLFSVKDRTGL